MHWRLLLQAAPGITLALSRVASAQVAPPLAAAPRPVRLLADRLAAYADQFRYEDLDARTIERVKAHVIDTLGCGVAAFDERPVRACREIALASPGGKSTVIGTGHRTAADLASFANGAAFRYFDLNDVYVGRAACHPSDNIAACLAVAESEGATAQGLITAIALAYEINCRLVDAFDIAARGWDAATVFSPVAVALAAGKLMKLTPQQLGQAIGLALNNHIPMGQTRAQTLSDWKGLADAEAARNGVFAAMLARAGISGPGPIFEGRSGFFKLVSGPTDVDVEGFGRRGEGYKINECGMKAYPVVVFAQTAVVASLAIAEAISDPRRIEAVEIVTSPEGYRSAGRDPEKWTPENRDTADHSLPYIAARAMLDGRVDNASYAPEKLRDPRIRAFMRKVTVSPDAAFKIPRGAAPPTRITATLSGGERITREVSAMPGFGGQPMDRAQIELKFRGNVAERWAKSRADGALGQLWALDQISDVRSLVANL